MSAGDLLVLLVQGILLVLLDGVFIGQRLSRYLRFLLLLAIVDELLQLLLGFIIENPIELGQTYKVSK